MNSDKILSQLRGNQKKLWSPNKGLEIQILDWIVNDITDENNSESESDSEDEGLSKTESDCNFLIKAYGNTINGTSVTLNINGFPPHFYVNFPESWSDNMIKKFVKILKQKMPFYCKDDIVNYDIVKRKKFYGFTNNKNFRFLRLLFKSSKGLYQCNKILKNKIKLPGVKDTKYEVYESNIPPLLRFVHIQDLFPSGWLRLEPNKYSINSDSNTQLNFKVHWKDVNPIEKLEIAPFIIGAYDIEADSAHGDFPMPKKDYLKFCQELTDYYYKYNLETKTKSEVEEIFLKLINEAFSDTNINISKLYTKRGALPNKIKRNIASIKLSTIFKRNESYKILMADILSNIEINDANEYVMDEIIIKNIIEDSFFDKLQSGKNVEKHNQSIENTFTKLNIKPNKPIIVSASKNILRIYNKLIKNLSDYDPKIYFTILEYYNRVYFLDNFKDKVNYYKTKLDCDQKIIESILRIISINSNQIISILQEKFPEHDTGKEIKIKRSNIYLSNIFPEIEGDRVIQIGTTVQKYGETECYIKHIITLDTCDPIEGAIVVQCKTEREVLIEWTKFINLLDPDIITGYNIFGFDYKFMVERALELGCEDEFMKLSRVKNQICQLKTKKLVSSALGDNTLNYIQMDGRLAFDIIKIVQRDHNLVSYKLDFVAETFINDSIINIDGSKLEIKNVQNLNVGNYITINIGEDKCLGGKKLKILEIRENIITIDQTIDKSLLKHKCKWCLAKDDVSPQDIFKYQKGSSSDRCIVATYCIQDCVLCLNLMNKLQLITNNIAMANTCSVPLSFIFLRGQGIKIFSLISKQCRKDKFLIPVIKYEKEDLFTNKKNKWNSFYEMKFEYGEMEEDKALLDDSFEGAVVLKPTPGIYLDKYIVVLDYASLYPSSMIGDNFSHDSYVMDEGYMGEEGAKKLKELGYDYIDMPHDVYKWVDPKVKNKGKIKTGEIKNCRFVQPLNGDLAVIPRILQYLLKARKDTRAKIKTETDEFKKNILDGQQLSYKITANSVYGGIGASTSEVCLKDIAASTTAMGRRLLYLAKDKVEEHFKGAKIIYGDTDSIFIDFSPKDEHGNLLKGKEGLKRAIELGHEAEKIIQKYLKQPHKCEYEKTFWPFILFSKKRYIGYKYETDINKYTETSMGIVLKRRDNAKIVKHVYRGVIDNLLKEKNIKKSISFIQRELNDLLDGKYPMDMLVITKSLRGFYKNPKQIAHKVLADRMGERDPGNKPMSNDRIPYIYVETKESRNNVVLQGDKIEHPKYIIENNLKIDYKFYITNQIMKPVGQIYTLMVEQLAGFNKGINYYENRYKYLIKSNTKEKTVKKINDEKFKDATNIVFGDILRKANNKKNRAREISDFFKLWP